MLIYGLEQALMVTHGYEVEFNQKKETATWYRRPMDR